MHATGALVEQLGGKAVKVEMPVYPRRLKSLISSLIDRELMVGNLIARVDLAAVAKLKVSGGTDAEKRLSESSESIPRYRWCVRYSVDPILHFTVDAGEKSNVVVLRSKISRFSRQFAWVVFEIMSSDDR
jgi:hypothetical protein